MMDVKKVPNVLRSIRLQDDSEYTCLEVTEIPGRQGVRVTLSEPDRDSGHENSITIELTADQWRVLQALDYIDAEPPAVARTKVTRLETERGSVQH